jgi:hypothetical protein
MELPDVLKTLQLEDTYLAVIEPDWDKSEHRGRCNLRYYILRRYI